MLIEINYQQPADNVDGFVVAQKLVREMDIVSVDPKPGDATRSVMRIQGSGSQFVQSFTDVTVVEAFADFKARYTTATATMRVLEADAL